MVYIISAILLVFSALFSGLTLGLLSLDKSDLLRKVKLGNLDAEKIYLVRENSNLLLVTLLVGNVLVNALLSVYLGSLLSGVWAVMISTVLIVVFGEILPQAFFQRHVLRYGSYFVPVVRVLIFILWPIAYPLAIVLEKLLGSEDETVWTRQELGEIIKDHEDSDLSDLDSDEQKILLGALGFSEKKAGEVMTHRDSCFMLSIDTMLTESVLRHIKNTGYTRIPVFEEKKRNIVGILYTKDLITVNPNIPLSEVYREGRILETTTDETLDDLLNMFTSQKTHMAYVLSAQNELIGLVTLEDIVEEIIMTEIVDEDDKS